MANEIRISASVRVANGNFKDEFLPEAILATQFGIGRVGHVQKITDGAEGEVLDIGTEGDIGALGWLVLRNLDTVETIDWGPEYTDGGAKLGLLGTLNPGEFAMLRLSPGLAVRTVLRAQASAADTLLDVRLYEN